MFKRNYEKLVEEFRLYREDNEETIKELQTELKHYLNIDIVAKENKNKDVDNLEYHIKRLERENAKYEAEIKHLEKELEFREKMLNKILDKEVINNVTTSK